MDAKLCSIEASLNEKAVSDKQQPAAEGGAKLAKPFHVQRLEKAFQLDLLLRQVESFVGDKGREVNEESPVAPISKQQLRGAKTRAYNFSKVKKSKKWLKNILLDKSDSSESDFETDPGPASCPVSDESIRDMIRYHNLNKKVKREIDAGLQVNQYQNYSSSLLAANGQSLLSGPTPSNDGLSKGGKKTAKAGSKQSTKKKTPVAASSPNTSIGIMTAAPVTLPAAAVTANEPAVIQVPTVVVSSASLLTPVPDSLLMDPTKRIKLESKMLDEIPYDMTLPDEILQSESSANVSEGCEAGPSCTPSLTDEIVYSNQLPDEIFDTEESSTSLLSQCMSQPATSVSVPAVPGPKCATAPPTPTGSSPASPLQVIIPPKSGKKGTKKKNQAANQEAVLSMKRKRLWVAVVRKEIPRAQKQKIAARKETAVQCKRMATWCQREKRKATLAHEKQFCRDQFSRARRLTKEMLVYWKHYERVEKDYRKRAEKEAQEQLRIDIELMEAKRQQRKLNFLITQTELYAHFMGKKISGANPSEELQSRNEILGHLDEVKSAFSSPSFEMMDDYDPENAKQDALRNAEIAFRTQQDQMETYDCELEENGLNSLLGLSDPSTGKEADLCQPVMFKGLLKSYQLKGINWLYNLYQNGINGILADEMGLGKTVQTIAFLASLAEKQSIWGPFLIVAPASTLHNWQQEFSKFTPQFKLLPYWGNPNDRKMLRKFWNQKYLHNKDASFHVLITSYQLIVQDAKYFQRIKWMYMALDEAQAIKSTSSVRWKILLAFQCRNRLLLTGTPIQNNLQELWALLHFIMPTLFDSHDEFNEWFSKDIESHAENKTAIDEKHLSRLHMILKPFMLRRIKKDVENELSDKIEIQMYCGLTQRQRLLYQGLKNKISIEDLLQTSYSSSQSSQSAASSLMNLVMQFRKVCNHPDLFERRDVWSPFAMKAPLFNLPRELFSSGLCFDSFTFNPIRDKVLNSTLSIFAPDYISSSLTALSDSEYSCFSFLRLINLSPCELRHYLFGDIVSKWTLLLTLMGNISLKLDQVLWREEGGSSEEFLVPFKSRMLAANRESQGLSSPWVSLLFTFDWNNSFIYTFTDHKIHFKSETPEHREMRLRKLKGKAGDERVSVEEIVHKPKPCRLLNCQPTAVPKFLFAPFCSTTNGNKVSASPRDVYCYDMSALRVQEALKCGGNAFVSRLLNVGRVDVDPQTVLVQQKSHFFPPPLKGLLGMRPMNGWSPIVIPNKESLVYDSGKLHVLDDLLKRLKDGGHRVLIYSQMTRMIDLLEEYMWHRQHTYMRLDGSSKISDRRDMVADFQTRSDIFVFLLSTRAGGLGINLTAADTVIFYDSDWNPTVDQQAMDRAHRLGQTKQVTVYRLICKGTIEERILQRAREKSEIQRMVISGGSFKPDTLKATEVVSLLLDDEELERKFRLKQEERKHLGEESGVVQKANRKARRDRSEELLKRKAGKKRKEWDDDLEPPASQATTVTLSSAGKSSQDVDSKGQEMDLSFDSLPPSPFSEQSMSSLILAQDEESNDGALIVDDGNSPTHSRASTGRSPDCSRMTPDSMSGLSPGRRGSGRSRGRPRGSRARGPIASRGRGPAAASAALAAAELAGAQAGKNAALAAYASIGPLSPSSSSSLVRRGRGRGRGRVKISFSVNQGSSQGGPSSGPKTPPSSSASLLGNQLSE